MTDNRYFLITEIEGPRFRVGIGDSSGQILVSKVSQAELKSGARFATLQILKFCDQTIASAGVSSKQLSKIVVSFDGPIDEEKQLISQSDHVDGWEDFPLCQHLSDQYRVPAILKSDTRLAALGVGKFGSGKDCENFLYIKTDENIAGALVLNGKLWEGNSPLTGDIGHMIVKPNGKSCKCGKRGCLNAYSSGMAITNTARDEVDINPYETTTLVDMVAGRVMAITTEVILKAAKQQDWLARKILNDALGHLALAIVNTITMVGVEKIIVGGNLTLFEDQLLTSLQPLVNGHLAKGDLQIPIIIAEDQKHNVLLGGIAYAMSL